MRQIEIRRVIVMKRNFLLASLCIAATLPATAQNKIEDRLGESTEVLTQILSRCHSSGGSASMATDDDANQAVYGKDISATEIVREGGVTPTPAGNAFVKVLETASPKHT